MPGPTKRRCGLLVIASQADDEAGNMTCTPRLQAGARALWVLYLEPGLDLAGLVRQRTLVPSLRFRKSVAKKVPPRGRS